MNRNVIGEGAYGCVHKPSIHCKTGIDPTLDYSKYVSKIMKTKDAEKELKEFVVIGSYDKTNEYHLGTPILCQPELNDQIIYNEISKCKYIESKSVKANPNNYKLLLLKYGGPDLKVFCMSELNKYLSSKKKTKTEYFWLEVHHLLKGLRFLKNNGLVHNDIKPQNILFDIKTGKLVFIDFGLMRSRTDIYNYSKLSKNFLGNFHWSYPFDCGLMNKNKYKAYKAYNSFTKNAYKEQLSNMIIADSKTNTFDLSIKNPSAFNILFSYINTDGKSPSSDIKYGYIQHFFDGFNSLIGKNSYDSVLNDIIDSIDVFGLGFTLQYILNCFYRHKAINKDFFTRLSRFFHKMYDFNPETREINIDNLINEYETILFETGILTKMKKTFVNNSLVDAKMEITTRSKNLEMLAPFIKMNIKRKACPENKELKISSNRCVNKCKTGFTRNARFKCVKIKNHTKKNKITKSSW
jgi:serine/threonine protein kinase